MNSSRWTRADWLSLVAGVVLVAASCASAPVPQEGESGEGINIGVEAVSSLKPCKNGAAPIEFTRQTFGAGNGPFAVALGNFNHGQRSSDPDPAFQKPSQASAVAPAEDLTTTGRAELNPRFWW